MMLQADNERNKYEFERDRQEKINYEKKNIDFISNPFHHEYFKAKKMEIIKKKITRKL